MGNIHRWTGPVNHRGFGMVCWTHPWLARLMSIKMERRTRNKPATRNITVMILVLRARHSGVGGGVKPGWRSRSV